VDELPQFAGQLLSQQPWLSGSAPSAHCHCQTRVQVIVGAVQPPQVHAPLFDPLLEHQDGQLVVPGQQPLESGQVAPLDVSEPHWLVLVVVLPAPPDGPKGKSETIGR
jgi:hypothetical protein